MKTLKQIYTEAADHIENVGWHQGGFYDRSKSLDARKCPACALGAIRLAAGLMDPEADWESAGVSYDLAAERLREIPGVGWSIADWNDALARTKEEVVALLREAAAHG